MHHNYTSRYQDQYHISQVIQLSLSDDRQLSCPPHHLPHLSSPLRVPSIG